MHPNLYCSYCDYSRKKEATLEELKARVMEIDKAIDCIANCDLSISVKELAINELNDKKANLKKLMHEKVDEL